MATFDLFFSDVEVGHPKFGFIARSKSFIGPYQAEEEDRSYAGHLRRLGLSSVKMGPCHAGNFTIDDAEVRAFEARQEWQKSG